MNKKKESNESKNENKIEIRKVDGSDEWEIFVNYAFETKTDITERTIKVADAFGIGIDSESRFQIFDNFKTTLWKGAVVYIAGDSGSGKSFLLENVYAKLDNSISMNEIKVDPNEILIEGVGKNFDEALQILNMASLGDAFLYVRKYSQLSVGQQVRYRIAKLIDTTDKDIWIIDEFTSGLDRNTAKIVAFNLQKIARKLGKTLIIGTAYQDLYEELQPDQSIDKGYGAEVDDTQCFSDFMHRYEYIATEKGEFLKDNIITKGTMWDYEKLAPFHYRQKSPSAVKEIYKMTYCDEYTKKEDLVAVLVVSYSPLSLKGRNKFTNNEYAKMTKENCRRINEDFAIISRVIVHPRYRGVGLASHFVKTYLEKYATTKYVETCAVMANYHPFFEKAGMIRVDVEEDAKRNEMVAQLEKFGFNTSMLSSARYCKEIFEKLNQEEQGKVKEIVKMILSKYKGAIRKLNNSSIDDVVEKELFTIMKELKRANVLYLVKKIRD